MRISLIVQIGTPLSLLKSYTNLSLLLFDLLIKDDKVIVSDRCINRLKGEQCILSCASPPLVSHYYR